MINCVCFSRNQWITNFTLSVDVFLTLSGCLTAYSWFRKWQKKNAGYTYAFGVNHF